MHFPQHLYELQQTVAVDSEDLPFCALSGLFTVDSDFQTIEPSQEDPREVVEDLRPRSTLCASERSKPTRRG